MMKLKNFKLSKKSIFWIVVGLAVFFLICACIFTAVGSPEFSEQLKIAKENLEFNSKLEEGQEARKVLIEAPLFTYGIFFWIMTLLTSIAVGLYGNSIFNKKYKNME